MKDDEANLLAECKTSGLWPRLVGETLGMHPKRVAYLCEKWTRQGIYEYGVTVDLGWFLPYDTEEHKRAQVVRGQYLLNTT